MTDRLSITDLPRDETYSLGTLRSALVKEFNSARSKEAKMVKLKETLEYTLARVVETLPTAAPKTRKVKVKETK